MKGLQSKISLLPPPFPCPSFHPEPETAAITGRIECRIKFYSMKWIVRRIYNWILKKKENTCASVVLYTEWMCDCHVLLKVSNTAIAEVSWSVPFIYIVIEFKQIKCPHLFVSYPDISFSALVESWLNCHVYFVFSVKSWMGNNTTDSFLP